MKKQKKILLLITLISIGISSCKDSHHDDSGLDPSQPIIFTDYFPKEGSVRTRLYIDGSNFGTDVSNISIQIGGVDAKVIGVSGDRMYCMVPPKAYSGEVKVSFKNKRGEVIKEHQFDEVFNYVQNIAVGTLVGKVDPSKPLGENSSVINGTYEEAEFSRPWWLLFDKTPEGDRFLYVMEHGLAMRRIDLNKEVVSSLFTNGQGMFKNMQTMSYSQHGDTIFIADDHGENNKNMAVVSYTVRAEGFRNVYPYIFDRTGYSCTTNPISGDLYYNTYWDAAVIKAKATYNAVTKQWEGKEMFKTAGNMNAHSYLFAHPEGKYVYIVAYHCIHKSDVIKTADGKYELSAPRLHAGQLDRWGYYDAPGGQALFRDPKQGVFVKNKEYVAAGLDDVYDFYLVEEGNHDIRIITPTSQVSTFAGRGSANIDNEKWGYIDGALREEARFRDPAGIAYDEENEIFYIADKNNKRIRTITIE